MRLDRELGDEQTARNRTCLQPDAHQLENLELRAGQHAFGPGPRRARTHPDVAKGSTDAPHQRQTAFSAQLRIERLEQRARTRRVTGASCGFTGRPSAAQLASYRHQLVCGRGGKECVDVRRVLRVHVHGDRGGGFRARAGEVSEHHVLERVAGFEPQLEEGPLADRIDEYLGRKSSDRQRAAFICSVERVLESACLPVRFGLGPEDHGASSEVGGVEAVRSVEDRRRLVVAAAVCERDHEVALDVITLSGVEGKPQQGARFGDDAVEIAHVMEPSNEAVLAKLALGRHNTVHACPVDHLFREREAPRRVTCQQERDPERVGAGRLDGEVVLRPRRGDGRVEPLRRRRVAAQH